MNIINKAVMFVLSITIIKEEKGANAIVLSVRKKTLIKNPNMSVEVLILYSILCTLSVAEG